MTEDSAPAFEGLRCGDGQAERIASLLALVRAEQVRIGDVDGRDRAGQVHGHLQEAAHHLSAAVEKVEGIDDA